MAKMVRPIPKPQRRRHFIKEWRKYRGLSQEQLAERVERTHGAISQLERHLTDYSGDLLEALAHALSCETWDLLHINPLKEREVVDFLDIYRRKDPALVRKVLEALPDRDIASGEN